jgi:hypothetical protein
LQWLLLLLLPLLLPLLLLLLQVFCAAAAGKAVLQAQQGQLHGEHRCRGLGLQE